MVAHPLLTLLLIVAVHAATAAPTPVILLTADDMSWDSVGAYGHAVEAPTPHIDALAAQSTLFRHAYVQVAVCTPSRHVMLTGQYSHSTHTEGFTNVSNQTSSLPTLLKKAGYYTAIINKGVGKYPWDFQADRKQTFDGRDPAIYAQLIRQIYRSAKEQNAPLFLMANTMDSHRPFHGGETKEEWPDVFENVSKFKTASRVYRPDEVKVPSFLPDLPAVRQEIAQYHSSVRRADDAIGVIMATLRELGIADDALIVFLSDHGMSMPFSKANAYRESLRVPLLVKLAGKASTARVIEKQMVSAVDLAPTVLDLLEMPIPEVMKGQSFKSLVTTGTSTEDWSHVNGYFYQGTTPTRTPMFTVQDRRYGYIVNLFHGTDKKVQNSDFGRSQTWLAMKADTSTAKRVRFHESRVLEELYDYETDPHALNNLIDDPAHAETKQHLITQMEAWMRDTQCPAAEAFQNRHDLSARQAYMTRENNQALERAKTK
jgi:N-sulfoglucosamine sulfohydrolase